MRAGWKEEMGMKDEIEFQLCWRYDEYLVSAVAAVVLVW